MIELEAVLSWFDNRMVRIGSGSNEGDTWGDLHAKIAYFGNGGDIWFKVIVIEDGTLWVVKMPIDDRHQSLEEFKGHLSDPKVFEKVEDYLDGF